MTFEWSFLENPTFPLEHPSTSSNQICYRLSFIIMTGPLPGCVCTCVGIGIGILCRDWDWLVWFWLSCGDGDGEEGNCSSFSMPLCPRLEPRPCLMFFFSVSAVAAAGGGAILGVYGCPGITIASGCAAFQAARCSYNCRSTIASSSRSFNAGSLSMSYLVPLDLQQGQTGVCVCERGSEVSKWLVRKDESKTGKGKWNSTYKSNELDTHAIDMLKSHYTSLEVRFDIRIRKWIENIEENIAEREREGEMKTIQYGKTES